MTDERASKKAAIAEAVRNPHWWFQEVLIAIIIGGLLATGSVLGQKMVDDRRADRELKAALVTNRHDLQIENLRFVRERAQDDPETDRRFAEFDLQGQNLVGLNLKGADFARADLTAAKLSHSDLTRANFARAALRGANLSRTTLRDAYFGPERIPDAPDQLGADLSDADLNGADLTNANLSHANLTGVRLKGATLTNVFYDSQTTWPQDFTPPASRPTP